MIWYVIITECMWMGNNNRSLMNQMSSDIRSGAIAYGMNKPYNYVLFCIAKHFGDVLIRLVMFAVVGLLLGFSLIGPLETFKIICLPWVGIVFLLGMLINAMIRMSISMFSFWMEDASPIHWIYDKFLLRSEERRVGKEC